jgi:hypothetical protein
MEFAFKVGLTYGSKVYDTCLTILSLCCESQGNGYMASTT